MPDTMSSSSNSSRRSDEYKKKIRRDRSRARSSAHELLAIVDEMSLRNKSPDTATQLPSSRFIGAENPNDDDEESGRRSTKARRAKKREKDPSLIGKAWNFLSDDADPELIGMQLYHDKKSKNSHLPSLDRSSSKSNNKDSLAARKKKNRPTVVLIGDDRPNFYKEGSSKPAVALGHGRITRSRSSEILHGPNRANGIFGGVWRSKKNEDYQDVDFANMNIAAHRDSQTSLELAEVLAQFSSDDPDDSDDEEEEGPRWGRLWNFRGETAASSGGEYEHCDNFIAPPPPPFNLKRSVMLMAIVAVVCGIILVVSIVAVEASGRNRDDGSGSSDRGVRVPAAPTANPAAEMKVDEDFKSNKVEEASPQSTMSAAWIPHPQPADHNPFGSSFTPTTGNSIRTTKNRCGLNWLDATRKCPTISCEHSSECLGHGEQCWQVITCLEEQGTTDVAAVSSLETRDQEP